VRGPRVGAERDTVAAVATPPGAGGIGIVRLSGPSALAIAARVVGRAVDALPERRMVLAAASDPLSGERLDEVMCVVMRAPRSFTGEDVAELHGHGGAVNMARLLRAVVAAGARHAEPGEFTRRAFENGRLDLTRAEAVLAVIEASSERALRVAQSQLAGRLGERVGELRREGTELLADLEASIDFPEEGLELAARVEVAARAAELAVACGALAATFDAGRALRDGVHVALCGPVNSGKSSLFNRLVGSERALVADEPGTTRDFVEARVVWSGISVTLIDTAGLREAASDVERRGIDLGAKRARQADVEVHLVPAEWLHGGAMPPADVEERPGRVLRIVSKGDALATAAAAPCLVTSAVTGQGIAELESAIVAMVTGGALEQDGGELLTSERQRDLVARAAGSFERAAVAVRESQPEEVIALEVREAVESLAEVLGESVGDEMLDALFARFCIGK
jgi:tRNA modification GTPase